MGVELRKVTERSNQGSFVRLPEVGSLSKNDSRARLPLLSPRSPKAHNVFLTGMLEEKMKPSLQDMERNMFYDTKFDRLFSKMHNETKTLNMYID